MLTVRSLRKTYRDPSGGPIDALRDCSLEVPEKTFTAILGRSGCGKTTLLKVIAGLEGADSGEAAFSRPGPTGPEGAPRPAPRVGFMFQDPRLLPWLTVEQNLALAVPDPPGGRRRTAADKAALREETGRALALVGLADRGGAYPAQLSGGMAQRAALARCLCRKPEILLLDEPLGSLDALTRNNLRRELDRLWRELALTVILVTHDIEEAVYLGDRVLVMDRGTMVSGLDIPLDRPRDYHGAEFQNYCKLIEGRIMKETPARDGIDVE
ncbi:MAG: ABC transporter ATP-binding protein [Treponema sp.]|jgi:ABC-type nitrate/sulfonate/bicarbonate transport system ATPase subunit|nr:ABC transporter ATP-binding protein [Treponema sp.]